MLCWLPPSCLHCFLPPQVVLPGFTAGTYGSASRFIKDKGGLVSVCAENSFRAQEMIKGNFLSVYIYIGLNLSPIWTSFSFLLLFSSFFFLVHVCLHSCRTLFYKTENIFPGWCKLWSNNGTSSPVIIPMPPGRAQINGLFWRRVDLDESWCYPGNVAALLPGWWNICKCGLVLST